MNSIKGAISNKSIEALIYTQRATTSVKAYITQAVSDGADEAVVTKALNALIGKYVNNYNQDERVRQAMKTALVMSAKKWYWTLMRTYNILNRQLLSNKAFMQISESAGLASLLTSESGNIVERFRPHLNYDFRPIVPVIENYQQALKISLRALAADSPKTVLRSNGKIYAMPLRNYAEMVTRYEANLNNLNELKNKGVKYVWTSSHPNASPRCAPFQGQLWSLDGTSGTINGIRFEPIEIALKGKLGDGNGIISGYNCRHRLVEYIAGSKAPNEYSEAIMKREYKKDQIQRRYENNIRHLSTEARLFRSAGLNDEALKALQSANRLKIAYQKKSIEMDRAYYPYRYQIDDVEVGYKEKTAVA